MQNLSVCRNTTLVPLVSILPFSHLRTLLHELVEEGVHAEELEPPHRRRALRPVVMPHLEPQQHEGSGFHVLFQGSLYRHFPTLAMGRRNVACWRSGTHTPLSTCNMHKELRHHIRKSHSFPSRTHKQKTHWNRPLRTLRARFDPLLQESKHRVT